jgi:hypothetical protein
LPETQLEQLREPAVQTEQPQGVPVAPKEQVERAAPVVQSGQLRKSSAMPDVAGKYAFAGKLDLYVIIAENKKTEQSRTFELSRRGKKRANQTLQAILQKARLTNTFMGSSQIQFITNGRGALQVVNGSDCTILVGADVLEKNQPYTLRHKDKVIVRDVHGISELVVSPRFLYRA